MVERDRTTEKTMREHALMILHAVHRSIDWRTVNPRKYWDRLAATVEVAAGTASSPSGAAERTRRMTQIGALRG